MTDMHRQWREERDLQIQRREEIAQKKKQETVQEAQKAIDDFYENYNNQKEKAIAQTRYSHPPHPPLILSRVLPVVADLA